MTVDYTESQHNQHSLQAVYLLRSLAHIWVQSYRVIACWKATNNVVLTNYFTMF